MEFIIEIIGKFLWDLIKDAMMMYIISLLKDWYKATFTAA